MTLVGYFAAEIGEKERKTRERNERKMMKDEENKGGLDK